MAAVLTESTLLFCNATHFLTATGPLPGGSTWMPTDRRPEAEANQRLRSPGGDRSS